MFSAQSNKNQSSDISPSPAILRAAVVFSQKTSEKKVKETQLKSQTRAVYNLGKLSRPKTVQMDYGYVLDHKSNLYLRHQLINIINYIAGITSYFLAFLPELVSEELDIPEKLEQTISSNSVIQLDGNLD